MKPESWDNLSKNLNELRTETKADVIFFVTNENVISLESYLSTNQTKQRDSSTAAASN